MLILDCEIANPVPNKKEPPIDGIRYCDGWTDYTGMGISVIGCYDYATSRPLLFAGDNFSEFVLLVQDTDRIVTFNGKRFDSPLLKAHGVDIDDDRHYDLFQEIKDAAGAGQYAKGYNLNNCCYVNLGVRKDDSAIMAPINWQRGLYGKVFNYALQDIMMTKGLLDLVIAGTPLIDPGKHENRIFVKSPAL